jgi:hypothetical protein
MSNSFELLAPLQVGNKNVNEDLAHYLYESPTLTVSGTSQQKTTSLNLTGIQVINFTGGIGAATIQSASLTVNATYIFFNTSGFAGSIVNLALDNGGTIATQTIFSLLSGQPQKWQWNGTNLS